MSETTLFISKAAGLAFDQALQACGKKLPDAGEAVALLYSPNWCRFGRLRKGLSLVVSEGVCLLEEVYEARVFSPEWELRWLNDPTGNNAHRTVLLSAVAMPLGDEMPEPFAFVDTLPNQYLLWGQKTAERADGWTQLTTARIGRLDVPFAGELANRGRMVLKTIEYLQEDAFGNVAVAEERLVCLEPLQGVGTCEAN